MPRANRVRRNEQDGGIFHITHRCHNREFLLKFARDRNGYREKLRQHVNYHEIMGIRRRYRLIDLDRLCWRLGAGDIADVRKNLEVSLAEKIERDQMKRDPSWTESLAVGSGVFVEKIKPLILSRR